MRLELVINDISVHDNGESLFPCFSLSTVKETLGIVGEVSHSAFEDAKDAAAVYRKMLKMLSLGV